MEEKDDENKITCNLNSEIINNNQSIINSVLYLIYEWLYTYLYIYGYIFSN